MQFEENKSLKLYNTFGLDAKAAFFIEATSIEELQSIIASKEARKNEVFLLGGGSNILLTKDFKGLVIKMAIKGIEIEHETPMSVSVKVGAGENWHQFVMHAIEKDWGGIENLSLIPGTVGAAPMQNIGAYGVEIKEVFEYLLAVNRTTGEVKRFTKEQCNFGYRESIFKNSHKDQYIISEVIFKLTKKEHQLNVSYGAIANTLSKKNIENITIKDVSNAVIEIRQSKLPDPKEIGNSGSFFKNPTINSLTYDKLKVDFKNMPGYELPDDQIKVPAGWLIEQCGWKGKRIGDIGVHDKQALVLVNHGDGNGKDLKALSEKIKESVIKKFGIELSTEVNII